MQHGADADADVLAVERARAPPRGSCRASARGARRARAARPCAPPRAPARAARARSARAARARKRASSASASAKPVAQLARARSAATCPARERATLVRRLLELAAALVLGGARRRPHPRVTCARRRSRGTAPPACTSDSVDAARCAPASGAKPVCPSRLGSKVLKRGHRPPPPAITILPSASSSRSDATMRCCAASTSFRRTGPTTPMSSRRISAARLETLAKIFSASAGLAVLSASSRSSRATSLSSVCMLRLSSCEAVLEGEESWHGCAAELGVALLELAEDPALDALVGVLHDLRDHRAAARRPAGGRASPFTWSRSMAPTSPRSARGDGFERARRSTTSVCIASGSRAMICAARAGSRCARISAATWGCSARASAARPGAGTPSSAAAKPVSSTRSARARRGSSALLARARLALRRGARLDQRASRTRARRRRASDSG